MRTRRGFLIGMAGAAAGAVGWMVYIRLAPPVPASGSKWMGEKVVKTEAEWRQELTPEQFRITREKGTERPFRNEYCQSTADGIYACVCCDQPLFDSRAKFDSGTGWPSYFQPVFEENVSTRTDRSLIEVRTEVLCSRCDAHLGHVFPDGPAPTGLRYCMNAVALKLVPRGG